MDKNIKTKITGFYEINLPETDKILFNDYLKEIFTEEIKHELHDIQSSWVEGYFVLDSKDNKLYPVEEFGFNISKKREVYDENKNLTPYRINIHNTRAKGQRSSTLRAEKYLADGKYTEANRYMKELGKQNKHIHADHLVPLRLGGIHDVKNLRKLKGKENIYKKDKLTTEVFEILKKDISLLSERFRAVFLENMNSPISIIEIILKKEVDDFRKKITNLPYNQKFQLINSFYKTYKPKQIERIIKKHFTEINTIDED